MFKKLISKSNSGQAVILVSLFFVVFAMLGGIAIDGGLLYFRKARLHKIVDSASLAGAKAMALAPGGSDPLVLATAAACDSARVNGLAVEGGAGTCPPGISVGLTVASNPDGSMQPGIEVTATQTVSMGLLSLGTILGCGDTCRQVDLSARGVAVPRSLVDLVFVLDDTGTMRQNCNAAQDNIDCPIKQARDGAKALVNSLLASGDSGAQFSVVPFRGCYAADREVPPGGDNGNPADGCTIFSEIQPLSSDQATVTTAIDAMRAWGGFPGTNVCLGMDRGRDELFGVGGRSIAKKVMIVLTDGDNRYSDGAQSDLLGNLPVGFAPPVMPPPQIPSLNFDVHDCRMDNHIQDSVNYGVDFDGRVNALDQASYNKATSLKDPNGDDVEIYVLRYAATDNDDPAVTVCNPSDVGQGSGRESNSDQWDRNLGRCLATQDPATNDAAGYFFYAASPDEILVRFQDIAAELQKERRLVN